MPIYVDPTETRDDSRLPPAVLRSVRGLPGLEMATGADILITPHEAMLLSPSGEPGKQALRWHLDHGAVLIQRKSGGDFFSSIPDLASILDRMIVWGSAWLLVTGLWPYTDESGMAYVDGQQTNWDFDAAEGALVFWQARGGCVQLLPEDWAIGGWLSRMLVRTAKWAKEPVKQVVQHQSTVKMDDDWVTSGSAFPSGIGLTKREALRDALGDVGFDQSLVMALAFATGDCGKVPGFGKELTKRCRKWIGLSEYARIVITIPAIVIAARRVRAIAVQPLRFPFCLLGIYSFSLFHWPFGILNILCLDDERGEQIAYHFIECASLGLSLSLCSVEHVPIDV